MKTLDAALAYAAQGLPVFPCNAKKVPLTANGFYDATVEPEQIRKLFGNGRAATISIPTGEATGFDLLDVDRKKGKDGTRHLPPNWMDLCPVIIQTPSGGYHAPFRAEGMHNHQLREKALDWRGDGGYMTVFPDYKVIKGEWPCDPKTLPVMPPELRYEAFAGERTAVKDNVVDFPAPDWLLVKVKGHEGKGTSTDAADNPPKATVDEIKAALAVIPANCSEDEWWRIAAALYDHFGGSEEGFEIFHAWSAIGGTSYKGERDCRAKWRHSANKDAIHIGTLFHFANEYDPCWRDGEPEPELESEPEPEAEAEGPSAKRVSPIPLFWPGEEAADETRWSVKGLIPEIGSGILAARRGAGKTFVAIDIAYALARLKTYIGKNIVGNVGTLWIAKEAPGQIPLRLRALPEEPGRWPFRYIKTCPRLLDGKGRTNNKGVDDIIAAVKVASEEMIERFGMPIGFVVIDTMRKAAGYGDRGENDPSQTGNVMQALSDIAEETRCFVLGVDHMGHDTSRGARGGTSKEDDADLVLYLDGEHGKGEMIIEKVRDGIDSIAVEYECVMVELGLDRDGDPVTTCRVELGDPKQAERAERASKMTKLLETVIKELGGLPRSKVEVRDAFAKRHGGSDRTPDKAFARAIKKLGLAEAGDQLHPKDVM